MPVPPPPVPVTDTLPPLDVIAEELPKTYTPWLKLMEPDPPATPVTTVETPVVPPRIVPPLATRTPC